VAHYECNCDADVATAFNCRPKMVKVIHEPKSERERKVEREEEWGVG